MKLTPGKLAGLKRVSNDRGVIAAAAMDQRGSLQKSLVKEKGGEVGDGVAAVQRALQGLTVGDRAEPGVDRMGGVSMPGRRAQVVDDRLVAAGAQLVDHV